MVYQSPFFSASNYLSTQMQFERNSRNHCIMRPQIPPCSADSFGDANGFKVLVLSDLHGLLKNKKRVKSLSFKNDVLFFLVMLMRLATTFTLPCSFSSIAFNLSSMLLGIMIWAKGPTTFCEQPSFNFLLLSQQFHFMFYSHFFPSV